MLTYYAIQSNEDASLFVAIDPNSGGYPYLTDFCSARLWSSKEEAEKYWAMDYSMIRGTIVKVVVSIEAAE